MVKLKIICLFLLILISYVINQAIYKSLNQNEFFFIFIIIFIKFKVYKGIDIHNEQLFISNRSAILNAAF